MGVAQVTVELKGCCSGVDIPARSPTDAAGWCPPRCGCTMSRMAEKKRNGKGTDSRESRHLFEVGNHHKRQGGEPPHVNGDVEGRYHGYFENEYGEQAIFIYDYEAGTATLMMGDAGWEEPREVVDGRPSDLILSPSELIWLEACWKAATAHQRR